MITRKTIVVLFILAIATFALLPRNTGVLDWGILSATAKGGAMEAISNQEVLHIPYSNAETVRELVAKSDLVVRARVSEAPVTRAVPIIPLDANGNEMPSLTFKMLFSGTVFDVTKIYVGQVSYQFTLVQEGGFDPTVSKGVQENPSDPLYKIGEEYILFLVNISGDSIYAPDGELYRAVNPFGRYSIKGRVVLTYGINSMRQGLFPTSLNDLEAQIEQAVQELK